VTQQINLISYLMCIAFILFDSHTDNAEQNNMNGLNSKLSIC